MPDWGQGGVTIITIIVTDGAGACPIHSLGYVDR
jgi:hypothetical protein